MNPIYAENIIVGIYTNKGFNWYITEKDDWILDLRKYYYAYKKRGFSIDFDFLLQYRHGIEVVDTDNINSLLEENYVNQKIKSTQLKKLVIEKQYTQTILDLSPSLYLDFVNKKLYSMYPEPLPFENYVPTGWEGRYEDFTDYLKEKDRYWIQDGRNLIQEYYQSEIGDEYDTE